MFPTGIARMCVLVNFLNDRGVQVMSRKTELRADLHRIGYDLSGSHLTREARCGTFNTFARIMRELGYGIQAASQIGGKHLQAFTQRRTSEGIGVRTLAKELSHLRTVLKHVDKQGLLLTPVTAIAR